MSPQFSILFCPKCASPQPMNVSRTEREEKNSYGRTIAFLITSYHCAACGSFVHSEELEAGHTSDRPTTTSGSA